MEAEDTDTTQGPSEPEGATDPADGTSSGPDSGITLEDDGATTLEDGSSSSGDPVVDPCDRFVALNTSEVQPCGLTHVSFRMEDDALSFAAQCQLAEAAECIALRPETVYLEAHASPDEGQRVPGSGAEESQILLADRRGEAVKGFLMRAGVPQIRLQVTSKGALDANSGDHREERRVELIWDK